MHMHSVIEVQHAQEEIEIEVLMETSAKRNVNRRANVPLRTEICAYQIPGRRLGIQIFIESADEQCADQVLDRRQGI